MQVIGDVLFVLIGSLAVIAFLFALLFQRPKVSHQPEIIIVQEVPMSDQSSGCLPVILLVLVIVLAILFSG